jgi:hypothetical protein
MPAAVARALRALEHEVADDPALAEAVLFLAAGPQVTADPFRDPGAGVVAAARDLNTRRGQERRATATGDALDTAAVVALVRSNNDRRGVDRRRRRGRLLGWKSGASTLHPAWQFDRRRGDTRPGLSEVLAAFTAVGMDAQSADAFMRAARADLEGRTPAALFATGRVETVVRLILAAGDQS